MVARAMNDGNKPLHETPITSRRFETRIELVVTGTVGLLALFVSAYTVQVQRQQLKVQAWPRVELSGFSQLSPVVPGEIQTGLSLKNLGVAPALVRSMEVAVGGKPVATWREAIDKLAGRSGVPGPLPLARQMSAGGTVIGVGQEYVMLVADSTRVTALLSRQTGLLRLSVCYCSVLDDCWLFTAPEQGDTTTNSVSECPTYSPRFVSGRSDGDAQWADAVLQIGASAVDAGTRDAH